jgi:hypothetical protein
VTADSFISALIERRYSYSVREYSSHSAQAYR